MVRREICLEAAARMTVGVAALAVGHAAGEFMTGVLPSIAPLVYLMGVAPGVFVCLYLVSTGLWVVVDGAANAVVERAAMTQDLTPDASSVLPNEE